MSELPEAFFLVRGGLPQAGLESDASTREAIGRIASRLPDAPRVLDIGCGPGRQTFALARTLPRAHIVAIDVYAPFLEAQGGRHFRARRRVEDQGHPEARYPRGP